MDLAAISVYGRIYLLTNTVNGKVYVGQTVQSIAARWSRHKTDSFKPRRPTYNYPLCRAIRKYGVAAFTVEELTLEYSREDLDASEIVEIATRRANNKRYGYNLRAGGDGGGRLAEETKRKISKKNLGRVAHNKGKPMPEHQRLQKIEQMTGANHFNYGQHLSEETKAKIGAANKLIRTGTKASAETKLRMSNSQMGRRNSPESIARGGIKRRKTYMIQGPSGEPFPVTMLRVFCAEKGISHGRLLETMRTHKAGTNGYLILELMTTPKE